MSESRPNRSLEAEGLQPLPSQSGRDGRLRYGDLGESMRSKLRFADLSDAHRFHIFMIGELAAAELAAANLYESGPSMPWEFVVDMARQCWDEARHFEINRRWCTSAGSRLDDFEAINIYYDLYQKLPLEARLAILCLVDETRALDGQIVRATEFVERGDLQRARSTERIMHEEIRHVSYGHRWLEHLAAREGITKDDLIARASEALAAALESLCGSLPRPATSGPPPRPLPIAEPLQLRAGFTPEELERASARQGRELGSAGPYITEDHARPKERES